jgi:hypothetical protein
MMKKRLPVSLFLFLLPEVAWAHDILGIIIALAMIPLVNTILVIVFAVVNRSGKAFMTHISLVVLWIFLFWMASAYTPSDFLVWLPIYLSIAHSLTLIYRIIRGAIARKKAKIV